MHVCNVYNLDIKRELLNFYDTPIFNVQLPQYFHTYHLTYILFSYTCLNLGGDKAMRMILQISICK